ncbi:MAG: VOC family protein [Cyanobacteria bacterium SZAS-4]|nr:VOC family protein [Cyanobacteria bacterium SZAS-4]
MSGKVKPIPDGYHTATPYLICKGAAKAIDFYKKAFGAVELMRMGDNDKIHHAEIKIGNSPIMLADEFPEMKALSPLTLGGSPITIMLYVEDVDSLFKSAVDAGATVDKPLENQFYGDRTGGVTDPFGHKWYLATHIEDVSHEELEKRASAATKKNMKETLPAGAK